MGQTKGKVKFPHSWGMYLLFKLSQILLFYPYVALAELVRQTTDKHINYNSVFVLHYWW